MEKPICKNCDKGFNPYKRTYDCNNCGGDGYCESHRDFGYDTSGFQKCWECNGKGEITMTEHNVCSEECWDEYEEKIFRS